jgi:uncharacterized membrane protein YhaH (DUF805 family)
MNAGQFFGAMFDPFKRITDFAGRSTRPQFWPFVFFQYAVGQIVSFIVISPFMTRLNQISAAQAEGNPDPEAITALFTDGSFVGMMKTSLLASAVLNLVFLVPLAGAAVRRLHDTNRSGLWTLPYAFLMFCGVFLAWRMIWPLLSGADVNLAGITPEVIFRAIIPLLIFGLLNLGVLITLIVFCVQDGTIGPNRYGEDPKGRDPAKEEEKRAKLAERLATREEIRKGPDATPSAPARIVE